MHLSYRVLWTVTLVLICVDLTFAITLSEYRGQVAKAISSLDQPHDFEEESQQDEFITGAVRNARAALPFHENVEWSGTSTPVDNSWLEDELKELETLSPSDPARVQTLDRIRERLEALQQRLQEIDKTEGAAPQSKSEMNDRLTTILNRTEYTKAAAGESAFKRLVRRTWKWLSDLFPERTANPGSARAISRLSGVIAVVLALLAIAYALRFFAPRLLRSRRAKQAKVRARIVLGEQLEPNQSAADLLAEAEALARAGDLRGAIRRGYIALLVELADRKVLSLAQHKTNRDYLRGVRGIERLYPNMEALTNNFELHWYGLVPADENDWAAFRARYRQVSSSEFRV